MINTEVCWWGVWKSPCLFDVVGGNQLAGGVWNYNTKIDVQTEVCWWGVWKSPCLFDVVGGIQTKLVGICWQE